MDGVVVYSVHTPSLLAALVLKVVWKSRTVVIVTDLPAFMLDKGGSFPRIRKLAKRIDAVVISALLKRVDGFVFLTSSMASYLQTDPARYMILEGIAEPAHCTGANTIRDVASNAILYTGGLFEEYGVRQLLEAYTSSAPGNTQLWLCGTGDLVETINAFSRSDSRIRYLGMLTPDQSIALQARAMCLINPRPIGGEFTKYSFPSKTIEYLAAARPVLSTRLPGIPDEYFDYLVPIEPDGVQGIAAAIDRICRMPETDRVALGDAGRRFVVMQKGVGVQGARLVSFLETVMARKMA